MYCVATHLYAEAETEGHCGHDENVADDGENDGAASWTLGVGCTIK